MLVNLLASHSIPQPKKLMLNVEMMKLVGMDPVEYVCIIEAEYYEFYYFFSVHVAPKEMVKSL